MSGRLKEFINVSIAEEAAEKFDEHTIAAAALLVEVATVDDDFSAMERKSILNLIRKKLVNDPSLSEELIACAEAEVSGTVQLFGFTTAITSGFSYQERVDLMQALWEVVLVDGKVNPYEDQLLRRIGGLIHVSDHDRGVARKLAQGG